MQKERLRTKQSLQPFSAENILPAWKQVHQTLLIVHVGNRVPTKGCFIGLSILGRVLIRRYLLYAHHDYSADAPLEQAVSYMCIVRPLLDPELGCGWTVRKVIAKAAMACEKPPQIMAVNIVSVESGSYLCSSAEDAVGENRMCVVHPADMKETFDTPLAIGERLEVIAEGEKDGASKNDLRVCCLASVVSTTPTKLEPTSVHIQVGNACEDGFNCPTNYHPDGASDLSLLSTFLKASGGLPYVEQQLDARVVETIRLVCPNDVGECVKSRD